MASRTDGQATRATFSRRLNGIVRKHNKSVKRRRGLLAAPQRSQLLGSTGVSDIGQDFSAPTSP